MVEKDDGEDGYFKIGEGSVRRFRKRRALIVALIEGVNCVLIEVLIVPFMGNPYCGNILIRRVNQVPLIGLLFLKKIVCILFIY